jgi:mannose-6-phosphate isomerase-like protein (cupin superfamily)
MGTHNSIPATAAIATETMTLKTSSYSISDLREQQQNSGAAWLEFLKLPTLSMGVYSVPAGTNDRESHGAHDQDEVYVGISGAGRLTADEQEYDIETGTVVYVKAGVQHYFHDVTDDLTLLVHFSPGSRESKNKRQ